MSSKVISNELIQDKIFLIRGQKVMLDRHLRSCTGLKPAC